MTMPDVSDSTLRWYNAMPAYLRAADEQEPSAGGYPLLRYLSLLGDQLGEVQDLVARIDYVPPDEPGSVPGDTSDLVDGRFADVAWLPWLAQIPGVALDTSRSIDEQRAQITGAGTGWLSSVPSALGALAATALIGSKYVAIVDHFGGDPWTIAIRTRASETPDPAAVLTAAFPAKPAGFILVNDLFATEWDEIEGDAPTWNDIEAANPWTNIEELGA